MPTTTPLNVLDELYLHLDPEDEPWSVHVEIRMDGPIECVALEAAVREAAARHPLARAQLAPTRSFDGAKAAAEEAGPSTASRTRRISQRGYGVAVSSARRPSQTT